MGATEYYRPWEVGLSSAVFHHAVFSLNRTNLDEFFLLSNFYFSTFMTQIFITLLVAKGPLSSVLLGGVLSGPFLRMVPVLVFCCIKY